MIQSIWHDYFIKTPFDEVGDLVVEIQKHSHDIKRNVSDVVGYASEVPGRIHDFFVDDYHPLMGAAFRFATLPLLLPTPLGPAAAAQAGLALAHVGSLAYDFYYYQDEIEEFFVEAKRRHQDAGTWYLD